MPSHFVVKYQKSKEKLLKLATNARWVIYKEMTTVEAIR